VALFGEDFGEGGAPGSDSEYGGFHVLVGGLLREKRCSVPLSRRRILPW
jgi:hypothetical protein